MAANNRQKLKLVMLLRILESGTDSQKGLSMPQLIERLEAEGISAERKSLYRDLDTLRHAGYTIVKLPKRPVEYALIRNDLRFDDVMMLIDAVQSSRFLSERKSNQLVKSLKSQVSERERKLLAKRVHVRGRIKSQSESVFHSVDIIHAALHRKRKVEFLYFSYGTDMKRHSRHDGKRYILTPIQVVYADSNYYLAAFDDEDQMIKTYRIDRMELLDMSDEPAKRAAEIANYEYEDFAYQSFGMFHGEPASVTLRAEAGMMDAMVDRFGSDLDVVKATPKWADVRVKVRVSPQFFGWLAGLNGRVKLRTPKRVVNDYRTWLQSLAAQ